MNIAAFPTGAVAWRWLAAWVSACVLTGLVSAPAHAGCMDTKRLVGVNLAGAEFGHDRLPGILHKDYIYPSQQNLRHFRSLGMTMVRVPFRWERIQRQLLAPLHPKELAELRRTVAWAKALHLCVVLDLHNFGSYHGNAIGSPQVPADAFIDVWLKLAAVFQDTDVVALGLMNEPASMAPPQWVSLAQATVLAIRHAGSKNLLLVPSGRWSGAHEWATPFAGASAADSFKNFVDPFDNFAIELHQYADANYSGMGTGCIAPQQLQSILGSVTRWAQREKKKLFLGEFGVGSSPECLSALKAMLEAMHDSSAWLGWTYWAAGPWWGNYPFSIQPGTSTEAPQLTMLRSYL